MRKKSEKPSKNQVIFGLKCCLLAVAIIVMASVLICDYILSDGVHDTLFTICLIGSLVVISVVMIFEIVPYIQLSNEGIRNIYREKDIEIEKFSKFKRMIDKNELLYKFQPIVSAKDGSIFAYESLMRTKPEVGLAPREILKYAEISQKLYDIEYYTFYNTLKIFSENQQAFGDRKVFINSIPSITLKDDHLKQLHDKFGKVTMNAVVEILEDAEDTEESLAAFGKIQDLFNCQIAIDDYGSGYSNESKLLHNNPNYIKIDINLITSIDSDRKKQLLVSNIIQFARKYGILVLGEGVETKEELQTLIELGVDLLQGFYIARPDSTVIAEIPQEIRRFIIGENIRLVKFNNSQNVYEAQDGETINLLDIALDRYTSIFIKNGNVHLIGQNEHMIEMVVKTDTYSECNITLENVNIKGSVEATIQAGANSRLGIKLIGDNILNKEGVRVPENSELSITGDGNLRINADRNNGVSLGGNYNNSFGSINIGMNGKLDIDCNGDKIVAIGGGVQSEETAITFNSGSVNIVGNSIKSLGIGAVSGEVTIHNNGADIKLDLNGNECVGIGTIDGNLEFSSNGNTEIYIRGEKIVGIGMFHYGNGNVKFIKGQTKIDSRGSDAVCIGSFDSDLDITCSAEYVCAYGEGTSVCGIGNRDGGGKVYITNGAVSSYLLSANPNWFGNKGRNVVVTGGSIIKGAEEITDATNSFGDTLKLVTFDDADSYAKHIITSRGDYVYRAEKADDASALCIFIPLECEVRDI